MTIAEMLTQSAILTVLGMLVVFSFLVILIACMNLLRTAVHAFKLDQVATKAETPVAAATPAVDEKAIVAAIATALHEKNN
ncbi:MAG: OadG family protein [Treponema sp.]|nr:OadG family protein [Treponema sp.]MBR6913042.1 OadG family protein [Treponema sp.]MCR5125131.1 OadG family protein [Treponema sp.]